MLITVFVFLGIEGASVYSRFATKREDVGRATVLGFLSACSASSRWSRSCPTACMPQARAGRRSSQPSMASVLESIVGPLGLGLHPRRRRSSRCSAPTWPGR